MMIRFVKMSDLGLVSSEVSALLTFYSFVSVKLSYLLL